MRSVSWPARRRQHRIARGREAEPDFAAQTPVWPSAEEAAAARRSSLGRSVSHTHVRVPGQQSRACERRRRRPEVEFLHRRQQQQQRCLRRQQQRLLSQRQMSLISSPFFSIWFFSTSEPVADKDTKAYRPCTRNTRHISAARFF